MKSKIDTNKILEEQEKRIQSYDAKTYTKKLMKQLGFIVEATIAVIVLILIVLGIIYERADVSIVLIGLVSCLLLAYFLNNNSKKLRK